MPRGSKKGTRPEGAMYCPGGHRLPRQGCAPVFCVEQRAGVSGRGGKKKSNLTAAREKALNAALSTKPDMKDLGKVAAAPSNTPADALQAQAEEAARLALLAGKHAARRGLVKVPEGLQGGDAEEYAQKKLVEMLPQAVGELEHQLTYGDDKQRIDAARDVLDANGMRRREQVGNMVPPIVLNFTGVLPWMQVPGVSAQTGKKVQERLNAQVVDGEATRSKDGESGSNVHGLGGAAETDGGGGQTT